MMACFESVYSTKNMVIILHVHFMMAISNKEVTFGGLSLAWLCFLLDCELYIKGSK